MQLPGGGGNKVVGTLQDLETSFNVMGYRAFRCLGDGVVSLAQVDCGAPDLRARRRA